MKYTLYENPVTHKFAIIQLPARFVSGDSLPLPDRAHWFDTRDEAIATLRDLLNHDD